MAFSVGLQLFTVRNEMKENLYATLKQVKAVGYDGVEFAGLFNHTPEEIRDICKDLGLDPISAHVPYADMLADPEGVLGAYKTIGCKFVVVPYLDKKEFTTVENVMVIIKNIEMLCGVAKKMGMTMLYHNHDFEFIKLEGKYVLDLIYDSIPADLLKTEIDTCWVNVGGENPAEYLLKYQDRSPIVHLKDFYGEKSENMYELIGIENKAPVRPSNFEFRPVGSGMQNFPTILESAKKVGAEWVIVEQDKPSLGLTPMESIAKSFEYVSSINK